MIEINRIESEKSNNQQLYEIGQLGMYDLLKELEKQNLYKQPILIGLLETLIATIFKKVNNDEIAINVIGNITASYIKKKETKH
tara:strand:+ start:172 stop:423 length:252 start_codon:yes stop_codon:yes gene_type:complete